MPPKRKKALPVCTGSALGYSGPTYTWYHIFALDFKRQNYIILVLKSMHIANRHPVPAVV